MSLSKEICKRCCEQNYVDDPEQGFVGWGHLSDMFWDDDGVVMCAFSDMEGMPGEAHVDEPPPSWCPYAAEHVVSRGSVEIGAEERE